MWVRRGGGGLGGVLDGLLEGIIASRVHQRCNHMSVLESISYVNT